MCMPYKQETKKAFEYLAKSKNINEVLEVGCGYGKDAYYLASNGINVTGIEYSKLAVEKANAELFKKDNELKTKTSGQVKLLEADFRTWQTKTKYPAVFSYKTLHQFRYNPDLDHQQNLKDPLSVIGLINIIKKRLKHDGYLIVASFNTDDHNYGKGRFIEEDNLETRKYRPCKFFTEDNIRTILKDFKIELFEQIHFPEDHEPDGDHIHYMWYVIAIII